jgi:hypothetical protein
MQPVAPDDTVPPGITRKRIFRPEDTFSFFCASHWNVFDENRCHVPPSKLSGYTRPDKPDGWPRHRRLNIFVDSSNFRRNGG